MKCAAVRIYWERVLLHLELKTEGLPERFEACLEASSGHLYRMKEETGPDERVCSFRLNITNPGTCACLPDGRYRVVIRHEGKILGEVRPSSALEPSVKEFPYNPWRDCCTVRSGGSPLRIVVRTRYGNRAARLYKALKSKAVTALYRAERLRYHAGRRKDSGRRVLFLSGQTASPGTNLTAVRDRMKERGLTEGAGAFRIRESCRDRGAGWRSVLQAIGQIAWADDIFVDDYEPLLDYLVLDGRTVLTQLWHAGVGFKSSGYSRWGLPGGPDTFCCHRQYTWGVVSSKAVIPIFSEIWGINDEQVLPAGIPRMDAFQDPEHRRTAEDAVRRAWPLVREKRVILFAPTYRGKGKTDASYPYEKIDFEGLYEAAGEDSVILFRMHPWVKEPVPIPPSMADRMADASGEMDINDLLYVTDLLITDYSSAICEYSLLDRPMLFYAFDEEEYASSRGFHRDYETYAPGRVCRSFEALLDALRRQDYAQEKRQRYVKEQFDWPGGGASDRVIDFVLKPNDSRHPEEPHAADGSVI